MFVVKQIKNGKGNFEYRNSVTNTKLSLERLLTSKENFILFDERGKEIAFYSKDCDVSNKQGKYYV